MKTRLSELFAWARSKLGPLAWGAIVVTLVLRISDAVSFVSKLVVGRWLEPIDFGAIEPVGSVLAFAAIPSMVIFGVGMKSISRLLARGDRLGFAGLVRDLAKISALGSLVSVVAILAAGKLILSRLHLDSNVYLLILGGMVVLMWWQQLARAFLQGTQKFHLMMITTVVAPVLVLVFTIVFVKVMELGLPGALGAKVLGPFIACAVFVIVVGRMLGGGRSAYTEELSFMKAMVLPMLIFVSAHTILMHFDRLFVRNFMEAESGGYGAVITIGQIPMWLIAPISFVLFPLAAGEHATGRDVARFYRQAMGFGIVITLGCATFFYYAGTPLLGWWNAEFAPYGKFVSAYAFGMGLQAMLEIVAYTEMARHRYSFLWFMGVPTVLMCVGVYLCEDVMTMNWVLIAIVSVRVLIVAAVVLWSSRPNRNEVSPGTV